MRKVMVLAVAALLGVAAGCGGDDDAGGGDDKLVVYSGREEELVEPLFERLRGGDRDRRRGALRRQRRARRDDRRGGRQLARRRLLRAGPGLARRGRARRAAREAADRRCSTACPRASAIRTATGSARRAASRVIAYNTDALTEDEVPDSDLRPHRPERGRARSASPPTNASFQAFVTRDAARRSARSARATWLEGMKANEPKLYEKNTPVVEAVGRRRDRARARQPLLPLPRRRRRTRTRRSRTTSSTGEDPGALVSASQASAILETARHADAAQQFVEFLLSEPSQRFYAEEAEEAEYPLVDGHRRRRRASRRSTRSSGPQIELDRARPRAREDARAAERGRLHDVSRSERRPGLALCRRRPALRRVAARSSCCRSPTSCCAPPAAARRAGACSGGRARSSSSSRRSLLVVAVDRHGDRSIGVPLAWLVDAHRPPRHGALIAVAAPLPLVIPSYVAALALLGAFGPRGLLQQLLEGRSASSGCPRSTASSGAWLALTLSTYPYVFLLAGAALRGRSTRRSRRRRAASGARAGAPSGA